AEMKKAEIAEFFDRLATALPEPKGELEYVNAYTLLVAVVLSAQAKNVIALSRQLLAEHGGEVPQSREALVKLPGVGRKTANVVLNIAFGQETIAVDTHIFRVANRTGLAPGKTVDEVERKLEKAVPKHRRRHAHHWLILHGRYVCKARKPDCPACIVRDLCAYKAKTTAEGPPPQPRATRRAKTAGATG
ncbi:nth, partial [Symbiodinium necroappetens]